MQQVSFFRKIPNKRELQWISSNHFTRKKLLQSKDLNINDIKNLKRLMTSIKHNWTNKILILTNSILLMKSLVTFLVIQNISTLGEQDNAFDKWSKAEKISSALHRILLIYFLVIMIIKICLCHQKMMKSTIHVTNDLFDIDFKDFMKLYKYYTKGLSKDIIPFSILVSKAILLSDNPLTFKKDLL